MRHGLAAMATIPATVGSSLSVTTWITIPVAGIWLIALGEWTVLGLGILIRVIGMSAGAIVLTPGMGLAAAGGSLLHRGREFLGTALLFSGGFLTMSVMALCATGVMYGFIRAGQHDSFVPVVLWAFSAAMAPWVGLASKEVLAEQYDTGDSTSSTLMVGALQLGCGIAAVLLLVSKPFSTAAVALFATTAVGWLAPSAIWPNDTQRAVKQRREPASIQGERPVMMGE